MIILLHLVWLLKLTNRLRVRLAAVLKQLLIVQMHLAVILLQALFGLLRLVQILLPIEPVVMLACMLRKIQTALLGKPMVVLYL